MGDNCFSVLFVLLGPSYGLRRMGMGEGDATSDLEGKTDFKYSSLYGNIYEANV